MFLDDIVYDNFKIWEFKIFWHDGKTRKKA
jgi:hypothetical protein